MSKFNKGDIVDVPWIGESTTRGLVHESWGPHISRHTGLPMVEVLLIGEGFVGSFDEDEVELALDEYEFLAVEVDQEDFEQTAIGPWEWGTLEYAESLMPSALADVSYRDKKQFQINRRRKAGHTVGYRAY